MVHDIIIAINHVSTAKGIPRIYNQSQTEWYKIYLTVALAISPVLGIQL